MGGGIPHFEGGVTPYGDSLCAACPQTSRIPWESSPRLDPRSWASVVNHPPSVAAPTVRFPWNSGERGGSETGTILARGKGGRASPQNSRIRSLASPPIRTILRRSRWVVRRVRNRRKWLGILRIHPPTFGTFPKASALCRKRNREDSSLLLFPQTRSQSLEPLDPSERPPVPSGSRRGPSGRSADWRPPCA